jgi:Holliday junction resolvasome RuvABC endonuclease subunit
MVKLILGVREEIAPDAADALAAAICHAHERNARSWGEAATVARA